MKCIVWNSRYECNGNVIVKNNFYTQEISTNGFGLEIFYFPSDTRDDASLLLSSSPLLVSSESPVLVIIPISFKNQFENVRNSKHSVPREFFHSYFLNTDQQCCDAIS